MDAFVANLLAERPELMALLKNFSPNDLNISLLGGQVSFPVLELNEAAVHELLYTFLGEEMLGVHSGRLTQVVVSFSPTRAVHQPLAISIERLDVVLHEPSTFEPIRRVLSKLAEDAGGDEGKTTGGIGTSAPVAPPLATDESSADGASASAGSGDEDGYTTLMKIVDGIRVHIGHISVQVVMLGERKPAADSEAMFGPWTPPVIHLDIDDVLFHQTDNEWRAVEDLSTARHAGYQGDRIFTYKELAIGSLSLAMRPHADDDLRSKQDPAFLLRDVADVRIHLTTQRAKRTGEVVDTSTSVHLPPIRVVLTPRHLAFIDEHLRGIRAIFVPPAVRKENARRDAAFTVRVRVLQAARLPAADRSGLSDPFVEIYLEGHLLRTSVKRQTLDAVWDEDDPEAVLEWHRLKSLQRSMTAWVYDWNRIGANVPLGKVDIPLAVLADGKAHTDWFALDTMGWVQLRIDAQDKGKLLDLAPPSSLLVHLPRVLVQLRDGPAETLADLTIEQAVLNRKQDAVTDETACSPASVTELSVDEVRGALAESKVLDMTHTRFVLKQLADGSREVTVCIPSLIGTVSDPILVWWPATLAAVHALRVPVEPPPRQQPTVSKQARRASRRIVRPVAGMPLDVDGDEVAAPRRHVTDLLAPWARLEIVVPAVSLTFSLVAVGSTSLNIVDSEVTLVRHALGHHAAVIFPHTLTADRGHARVPLPHADDDMLVHDVLEPPHDIGYCWAASARVFCASLHVNDHELVRVDNLTLQAAVGRMRLRDGVRTRPDVLASLRLGAIDIQAVPEAVHAAQTLVTAATDALTQAISDPEVSQGESTEELPRVETTPREGDEPPVELPSFAVAALVDSLAVRFTGRTDTAPPSIGLARLGAVLEHDRRLARFLLKASLGGIALGTHVDTRAPETAARTHFASARVTYFPADASLTRAQIHLGHVDLQGDLGAFFASLRFHLASLAAPHTAGESTAVHQAVQLASRVAQVPLASVLDVWPALSAAYARVQRASNDVEDLALRAEAPVALAGDDVDGDEADGDEPYLWTIEAVSPPRFPLLRPNMRRSTLAPSVFDGAAMLLSREEPLRVHLALIEGALVIIRTPVTTEEQDAGVDFDAETLYAFDIQQLHVALAVGEQRWTLACRAAPWQVPIELESCGLRSAADWLATLRARGASCTAAAHSSALTAPHLRAASDCAADAAEELRSAMASTEAVLASLPTMYRVATDDRVRRLLLAADADRRRMQELEDELERSRAENERLQAKLDESETAFKSQGSLSHMRKALRTLRSFRDERLRHDQLAEKGVELIHYLAPAGDDASSDLQQANRIISRVSLQRNKIGQPVLLIQEIVQGSTGKRSGQRKPTELLVRNITAIDYPAVGQTLPVDVVPHLTFSVRLRPDAKRKAPKNELLTFQALDPIELKGGLLGLHESMAAETPHHKPLSEGAMLWRRVRLSTKFMAMCEGVDWATWVARAIMNA